jgi:hypothetical protein
MKTIADLITEGSERAEKMRSAAQQQDWDLFQSLAQKAELLWPELAKKIQEQNDALAKLENIIEECTSLAEAEQEHLGEDLGGLNTQRKANKAYLHYTKQ